MGWLDGCFWIFHAWGKWEVDKEGEINKYDGKTTGYFVTQKRVCKTCNFTEIISSRISLLDR